MPTKPKIKRRARPVSPDAIVRELDGDEEALSLVVQLAELLAARRRQRGAL